MGTFMAKKATHCYPYVELRRKVENVRRKQIANFVGYHTRFGIASTIWSEYRRIGFGF